MSRYTMWGVYIVQEFRLQNVRGNPDSERILIENLNFKL